MQTDDENRQLLTQLIRSITAVSPHIELQVDITHSGQFHFVIRPLQPADRPMTQEHLAAVTRETQAPPGPGSPPTPAPPRAPRLEDSWLMLSPTEEALLTACTAAWQRAETILMAAGFGSQTSGQRAVLANMADRKIIETKPGRNGGYRLPRPPSASADTS